MKGEITMPLPIINPEIIFSIEHEISKDKFFIETTMKMLTKENPSLARFIVKYSDCISKDGKDPSDTIFGMLTIYKLLKTQQEVDDLDKNIG